MDLEFTDKAVNHVIKWDSMDISISEMLNLIQSELLEKASSSDLHELEKGMTKTWVLGVGGGANRRYYPASNRPVRLCFQFNIITHQLQQISLQDTINKIEYFIPSGKAACTKLQRAVLRRIVQYSNVGTGEHRKSGNGGRFLNKKKKPAISVFSILCFVAVIVAVIGLISILSDPSKTNSGTIATVQNGYLGEYTDMTVQEVFDAWFGLMYEKSEWSGGTTDSGNEIVEVKYWNEGNEIGPTTIQFTMLDEECFKISGFVSHFHTIEQSTDLYAELNYIYTFAHAVTHPEMREDKSLENALVLRLDSIDATAVAYGASSEYEGNRSEIAIFNGTPKMGVSAAMILDRHNYLDMSYYWTINGGQIPSVTEDSPPVTIGQENHHRNEIDYASEIEGILSGRATFLDFWTGDEATIYSLPEINSDYLGSPNQYAILDIDGDLEDELLVEYSVSGDTAIIDYLDGVWTAHYISYRDRSSLKADGTMSWSNGAAESGIQQLIISKAGIHNIVILSANTDLGVYTIDGVHVGEWECQQMWERFHGKDPVVMHPIP